MKKKTKRMRNVLLEGEGVNRHVLYGTAEIEEKPDYRTVVLKEDGFLKHEDPEGGHAEHETLRVAKGEWVMGLQVEYDPFAFLAPTNDNVRPLTLQERLERSITRVWD